MKDLKPAFRNGPHSVGPDVKMLMDAYPHLEEGRQISFHELETILNLSRDSNRFKRILTVWRRILLYGDTNTYLRPMIGSGLVVADPNERIQESLKKNTTAQTYAKNSGHIASTTDRARLTPEAQRVQDHLLRVSATMLAFEVSTPMVIHTPLGQKGAPPLS